MSLIHRLPSSLVCWLFYLLGDPSWANMWLFLLAAYFANPVFSYLSIICCSAGLRSVFVGLDWVYPHVPCCSMCWVCVYTSVLWTHQCIYTSAISGDLFPIWTVVIMLLLWLKNLRSVYFYLNSIYLKIRIWFNQFDLSFQWQDQTQNYLSIRRIQRLVMILYLL